MNSEKNLEAIQVDMDAGDFHSECQLQHYLDMPLRLDLTYIIFRT